MKNLYILFILFTSIYYSQDLCSECPSLYENKKFEEIINIVKPLGEKASVNDLLYLGKSFQSLDDKKNAIKAYETLLLIDDKNVEACIAVSALFIDIESYENAKFAVERALKFDKENVNALYNLGVIYYYQKDEANFQKHIKKYISNSETKDEFYYLLALTQIDKEKYNDALNSLNSLENANPKYEFLSFYQAYCLFNLEQYEKAKEKFTEEINKKNDLIIEAYYFLAHCNIKLNNKVDACEAYNNAINLGDITITNEANSYCEENSAKKTKNKIRKASIRL